MDVSWETRALLDRVALLPPELAHALQDPHGQHFLHQLSRAALDRRYTDLVLVLAESLVPHCCASFNDSPDYATVVSAYARLLPFAPHVAEYAERYLAAGDSSAIPDSHLSPEYLLALYRLLRFDRDTFAKFVPFARLHTLLEHAAPSVRYLAIRVLCLYLRAADAALHAMVRQHLKDAVPTGPWEKDQAIDYRFLTLWEERRAKSLQKMKDELLQHRASYFASRDAASPASLLSSDLLHPSAACVSGVLLPRAATPSSSSSSSPSQPRSYNIVDTQTTAANLHALATSLKSSSPALLTGLAGSGKTLLVRHAAHELSKLQSMVTLHLNEQSDAKLLIGMYTTGNTPGSFIWQPGVLTTAVTEGRWVFIEDLDRAPNDVISTLLPLIERRELVIPSRGQTVHAARGFRIIATMRTTLTSAGHETRPAHNLLGARHWQSIHVSVLPSDELRQVIVGLFPSLTEFSSQFVTVFERLQELKRHSHLQSRSKTGLMREVNPRDLFKWCARVCAMLGDKANMTPGDLDQIFLDAVDCFAGALPEGTAYDALTACIAQHLQIDPQRRQHLLRERTIAHKAESTTVKIGRSVFARQQRKGLGGPSSKRAFSTNAHTLRLLDRVAVTVSQREPLLLVGETGTGKTTSVQHLADQLGKKLVPFNLSQQSESGDLLGGFKPVNARSLIIPLKEEFDDLFSVSFSYKRNAQFLDMLNKCMAKQQWVRVCKLWNTALGMVEQQRIAALQAGSKSPSRNVENPAKKRKVEPVMNAVLSGRWDVFAESVKSLEHRLSAGQEAFAFAFVEGNIVKAVRNGDWVLLDEINLASPDTLEALADLFDASSPSLMLSEAGSVEVIKAHPQFRVFAAMNPATDVGKKDLPLGIRSRFTELYVESPDRDYQSLRSIVQAYLGEDAVLDKSVASDVSKLHQAIQKLNEDNLLVDGAGQKPHFSLRTLTRALVYAKDVTPQCSVRRALSEGIQMSFLTLLDKESEARLLPLIQQHMFGKLANAPAELRKPLRKPEDHHSYVKDGQYWLRQGNFAVHDQPQYIITPFIRRNLDNLIRASFTRRFPVLIQGPTSAGKTSMIEYLANKSGNKFVRINNHEHTDLQEYLGTYVSGSDGRLQFQEGVLVKALREGHWIVLDELNLAPTDVLEALNRLLDDNRELLIPETQETVRPHENFMLFATQNPAGLYGGRKVLSRAFRNRFLELHFDDIPVEELHEILHRRTQIPDSWCKRIVSVYKELSILRQEERMFEQKSFATLRDLFRWALRRADTIDQLAVNGFMLLAERVRKLEERQAVKKTIEKVLSARGPKVTIDESLLYGDRSPALQSYFTQAGSKGVVWTNAMRRLYVLVATALQNNEPVLLVGETGCGKTTVCQMLADAIQKELHIVNAHQNTETGDLIGAQRPLRNRSAIEQQLRQALVSLPYIEIQEAAPSGSLDELFSIYDRVKNVAHDSIDPAVEEAQRSIDTNRPRLKALFEWADGSLVHAMKTGQYFLLDEISLADDSVLERLNSVLEPSRTLLLAEKGSLDSFVTAQPGFQFFATMNPGGDYGKRELSPALRNRFTEIWVPALSDVEDVLQIVRSKLREHATPLAHILVEFAQWFNQRYNTSAAPSISIRDTLAWVEFINRQIDRDPIFSIVHGAAMVYIDTLGANPAAMLAINPGTVNHERSQCLAEMSKLIKTDASAIYYAPIELNLTQEAFSLGSFTIPVISQGSEPGFTFLAPTTRSNAMRVVRALQLTKPVLLEGNPGVGKTTLVTAVAQAIGMPLTRINLSEQTDLMDLFGSDVPVEGAEAGTFAWRDAPFLRAMKNGEWVLLDEMNLASQSVLEGLNACLDHRGEIYISELDQTFRRHPDFRLFAAQNPHHQGGGRKGLPASFVNRFTVVYADVFSPEDLMLICQNSFPQYDAEKIKPIVDFIDRLDVETQRRRIGSLGGPWEFNLRDTLRWLSLVTAEQGLLKGGEVDDFFTTVISQRFRTPKDRALVLDLFRTVLHDTPSVRDVFHNLGPTNFQVGLGSINRNPLLARAGAEIDHFDFKPHLSVLESVMVAIQKRWPVLLVGPSGSGKTAVLEKLAGILGVEMVTFSMNADVDSMDLVGGYEQSEPQRALHRFLEKLSVFVEKMTVSCLYEGSDAPALERLRRLHQLAFNADNSLLTTGHNDISLEIARLLQSLIHGVRGSSEDDDEHDFNLEAKVLLDEVNALISKPAIINRAQFEWIDGMLVQALERGEWLVLDNANLCSPAVLDRLNSLLEPNGLLIINENTDATGQARTIKPHPNFRIFFTMDPKYGELSRALRNRAVEIFLLPQKTLAVEATSHPLILSSESAMHRFRNLEALERLDPEEILTQYMTQAVVQSLSPADTWLFPTLISGLENGLYDAPARLLEQAVNLQLCFKDGYLLSDSQRVVDNVKDQLVQPFHPFNNVPLVRSDPNQHPWAAALYELEWDLHTMRRSLEEVRRRDAPKREQTRLQRSAVGQGPKQKHFTAPVFGLLRDAVEVWFRFLKRATLSKSQTGLVENYPVDTFRPWRRYWWGFFQLVDSTDVDEAVFKAYIEIGVRLEQSHGTEFPARFGSDMEIDVEKFTSYFLVPLNKSFSPDNKGASMRALWTTMKPQTARTYQQLQDIVALERMADKFDVSAWKFDAPLDQILYLRNAFSKALGVILDGSDEAAALIASLREAMPSRASEEDEIATSTPHFQEQFEAISQAFDMLYGKDVSEYSQSSIFQVLSSNTLTEDLRAQLTRVAFFALRPTKFCNSVEGGNVLRRNDIFGPLGKYVGFYSDKQKPLALETNLQGEILFGVEHMDDVPLRRLELLRTETTILGQVVSGNSHDLETDPVRVLDCHLAILLDVLLKSLRDVSLNKENIGEVDWTPWVEWASESFRTRGAVSNVPQMGSESEAANVCQVHLNPLVHYLAGVSTQTSTTVEASAKAWLRYALACMSLYITSKPSDPALRPMIDREMFRTTFSDLQTKLASLRKFFDATGLHSSLRVASVQQEIAELGEEPTVQDIARPPVSEISKLQGELNALQRALKPLFSAQEDDLVGYAKDSVLRQNVAQVKARLSEGYRAYADITGPVLGFLHCLEVGFALASTIPEQSITENMSVDIKQLTPLGGALPHSLQNGLPFRAVVQSPHPNTLRLHTLSSFAFMHRVLPPSDHHNASWDSINEIFDSIYQQWRLELQTNQQQNAADHSLYTFRGDEDFEDETAEAEYQELFPEYETDKAEEGAIKDVAPQRVQGLASGLATVFSEIFKKGEATEEDLLALVKKSASLLGKKASDKTAQAAFDENGTLTPLLIMLLQDKTHLLTGASFSKQRYNIYTDANLEEADRLIVLIRKLQARFKAVQDVWPEHATLGDVLHTCDELLDFKHTDPVAKIITKAEKLHSYVHEWQVVASREYSAAPLYDELTNLLVSWRQLELSTWSRLLDMETEKCDMDSKSWFYIAYENIIVVPLTLGTTEVEMKAHVTELIKTLYGFFSSTGLGQFSARLRMLNDFREYVKVRTRDASSMSIVATALSNFVSYMSRFEPVVAENLAKGRQKLEKDMKNIIQLASWKDTNIDALRVSAKASHRKLFRIIRKFRAVLGQPCEAIVSAGLPDIAFSEFPTATGLRQADAEIDPKASALCVRGIPTWNDRPARFRNTSTTLSVMLSKAQIKSDRVDGATEVNTWLSDTEDIAAQLRKATPQTLTEENKETVKHLKSRKRKLFADVLKELRNMGFKSNLSSDVLAQQDSLQAVLAAIPVLESDVAEGYLHRLLYLMPRVREAPREHSDDLTSAEIARSVALCESMLQTLVQQRNVLGSVANGQELLESLITQIENIWGTDLHKLEGAPFQSYDLSTAIACLPVIMRASTSVIVSQSSLGKLDCGTVVKTLQNWSGRLDAMKKQWKSFPQLPAELTSSDRLQVVEQTKTTMHELRAELSTVATEHPYLNATLRQVQLWASVDEDGDRAMKADGERSLDIDQFSQAASDFIDAILGSVQDLEKPLNELPVSVEDSNWLLQESHGVSAALRSLRLPYVTSRMQELLGQISHVSGDPESLNVATALLHSLTPFVIQYRSLATYLGSRLSNLHAAISQMSFRLARIFVQLSKEGFCTPPEKSANQEQGNEKLEGGTGLGSGEGAEDISKDVEDDEDLGELAQEKDDRDDKDEIEDEKDAVDMADQEMEGQMGDAEEKEDEEDGDKSDEGEDEMEDEVGDVDDLGPSTVDEKMWDDGGKDDADKDKEGDNTNGTKDQDEMTAAEGEEKEEKEKKEDGEGEEDEEEPEQAGADETEHGPPDETEKADPHMQEEDNLDLPDDIDMDGNKSDDGEDSGMEDMGDVDPMDEDLKPEGETEGEVEDPSKEEDLGPEDEIPADLDAEKDEVEDGGDEEQMDKTQEAGEDGENPEEEQAEEDESMLQDNRPDDTNAADEVAPSEAQGAGLDDQQAQEDQKQENSGAAQRESGTEGAQDEQQQTAGAEGERGQAENQAAASNEENTQDAQESMPYKKIGDALEKWYRQQKQIQDARTEKEERKQEQPDIDMADAEFEHLQDEADEADAQALGAAAEDQAKAIDEDAGVATNENETREDFAPEQEEGETYQPEEDVEMQEPEATDKEPAEDVESVPNAFVGEPRERAVELEYAPEAQQDEESDVEEVDHQLTDTHLYDAGTEDETSLMSLDEAREIYNKHENSTRNLSLMLAEHLRLILSPTQATKMRGDFRTGKRLNIKRIIPYIASSYKRDKIWMRRSVPSKRTYQIMLAIDDSQSMSESGSSGLAFETMALVARALTTLEAGELCIVGFGENVRIAHDFATPFTAEAGANVVRRFGFEQTRTNVKTLVARSLEIFQAARLRASGSASELWQLQLIVSDGVCEDHGGIRQLVRQAHDERIMMVFVIVDAAAATAPSVAGKSKQSSSSSILDLQTAEFVKDKATGEMQVKTVKYLDSFPFGYYLVVRDVLELPGVLAGALRQWFAEVVETA